jgi:hypothetical protein
VRDQRVATLISTIPATTQSRLPQSHNTQQRDRNIALFHRLIANLPIPITLDPELFETTRAYLSDIAHSNPALDTTAQPIHTTPTYSDDPHINPFSPLVQDSSDDDTNSDDEPPPLTTLTDDEHNTLTRLHHSRTQQTHTAPANRLHYDMRIAPHTSDSDSSHIYSEPDDASDEGILPYWPAQAPPIPPLSDPYPPATLTDAQTIQWTRSQMPWHLWLQQQISLGHIPNERNGPPAIHREMPNRTHMRLHTDPSVDTLTANQRMLGYLQSNISWSTYLNTLPPIARRHYLNMPPNYSDVHTEITQSPNQPTNYTRSSLTSTEGYHSAPVPTATTAPTTRETIVTSHSLSRPGGYNPATIAAKRSHTDPRNCETDRISTKHHGPRPHTRTERTRDRKERSDSSDQAQSRPRIPQDGTLTQHLTPQKRELARTQLNNHILTWYRKNGHHDNRREDPHPPPAVAQPSPDAAPPTCATITSSNRTSPPHFTQIQPSTSSDSSPIIIQSRTPSPTFPAYEPNSPLPSKTPRRPTQPTA